jgi:hypothetical protein
MNKLIVVVFLLSSAVGFSGPWVPALGGGYAQLSATPMWYSSAHGTTLQKDIIDNTFQYYMEYGIGKGWGLKTIIPIKSIRSTNQLGLELIHGPDPYPTDGELRGIGNTVIEINKGVRLFSSGYSKVKELGPPVSYGLSFMLPPTKVDAPKALYPGFNTYGIKPKVSIGGSSNNSYRYMDIGYLILFNDYTDLFQVEAEYGFTVRDKRTKLLLALSLNSSVPVVDIADADYKSEATVLYSNTAGYVCPGVKGIYQLNNGLEFNAAIFGAVWGRLVAAVPSVTIGVGYKWKRSIRGVTPETVWE